MAEQKPTGQAQENPYVGIKKTPEPPDTFSQFLSTPWQRTELPGARQRVGGDEFNPPQEVIDESKVIMKNPKTGESLPMDAWKKIQGQKLQEKQVYDNWQKGLDAEGRPISQEFQSFVDPTTGLLKEPYQYQPEKIDLTKLEGFQALKKRVLTEGPSAWAKLMLEKQAQEESMARDQAARQAVASASQARAELAMRGGVTSGARERLAMTGGRGLMEARQAAAQQGILSRASTLTEDERQRMSLLPGFAEGEAKLNEYNVGLGNTAKQYNIQSALREQEAQRAWESKKYEEQMRAWAAEREAQATERAGSGGGGGGK